MSSLSVSMRPDSLEEVIGHSAVKAAIQKAVDEKRVPTAFMFSGPPGVGKTTLARIVAKMVGGADPVMHNAADLNGVDAIRELVEQSVYRPLSGQYRVVILDEAQQLTAPAQNVLLNPFEVENSATIWILTTTDPQKIIQPLQDRCKQFKLGGLPDSQSVVDLVTRAEKHLGFEDQQATNAFIDYVQEKRVSTPRVILQAYEKYASGIPLAECFSSAAHEPLYADIAKALVRGEWNQVRAYLEQVKTPDIRGLRAVVSAFLRSALVKSEIGARGDALATCLLSMGAAYDDGSAYAITVAAFYKCCRVLKKEG